jgi:hypothetical protein
MSRSTTRAARARSPLPDVERRDIHIQRCHRRVVSLAYCGRIAGIGAERFIAIPVEWRDQQAGTTSMSDRYIIEVGSLTAGIVVREKAGFRFFAAAPQFFVLEGQVFRSPRAAERAAAHCAADAPLRAA